MKIYIFQDIGASRQSAQNMKFALSMALQDWDFEVSFVNAEDIRGGILSNIDKISLFVIGGGSFTEVKKRLGQKGMQAIQNYLQNGGGYCGVCMGAYAAFSEIKFQGKEYREGQGLAVFNALVRGHLNITPPFDGTVNSATIIDVNHIGLNIKSPALYWGGFDMPEDQPQALNATPLSNITLPDGTKRILSLKQDRGSLGNPIFLSSCHFEAFSRDMIWKWFKNLKGRPEDSGRLQKELTLYPANSYYMGLACALDNMELVKGYSFRQRIWPELQGQENTFAPSPCLPPSSSKYIWNP